jgi:hypothetical protein
MPSDMSMLGPEMPRLSDNEGPFEVDAVYLFNILLLLWDIDFTIDAISSFFSKKER